MKRTPVRPSLKAIPRYTRPKRSTTRIRSRRADPSRRAFAKHRDYAYQTWIKTLPCLICGRPGVDPAHVIKRSRGSDDRNNLLPLCRAHHDSQEGKTAEFELCYRETLRGRTLAAVARELTEEYDGG